jgi:hypothetical protein
MSFWNLAKTAVRIVILVDALAQLTPVLAAMKGNFADADTNHDGRVTLHEFEAYAMQRLMSGQGMMAARFQQMSQDERAARLQSRFESADSGHKGYLTVEDWQR